MDTNSHLLPNPNPKFQQTPFDNRSHSISDPIDFPLTNPTIFTRHSYEFDVLQIYEPYASKVKYYFLEGNI